MADDPLYPVPDGLPDFEEPAPETRRLSPDQYAGSYKTNLIDITLEHVSGKMQAAVAGDPDADPPVHSRIVYAHAPYTKKVVEFHVVRTNLQPDVPSPIPPDSNHVLEAADIKISSPAVIEDGQTFEWEVQGRYQFALITPWRPGLDTVQAAVMPWTTITLAEAIFAVERFKAGMLGEDSGSNSQVG